MTEATATATPNEEGVLAEGVNVLLMGPAGTGKTFSIGTLVDAGIEVFFLGLEPGLESLLGYWKDKGKPIPENLHWHMLAAPKATFADFKDKATKINTMSLDTLAKAQDPNRHKHNQFIQLVEVMSDFPDQRTGKKFGAVDDWTPAKALVVDGMAGLGRAAMSLVIGGKAVRNQSDWGIAQDQVEQITRMWTADCKCHFVMIAHVERETDAVLGGVKLMVSALGSKLAPKLPPMFSDVILTTREGGKFSWDTGSAQADVKTRNLPIQSGLPADFRPIIEKWKKRGGQIN